MFGAFFDTIKRGNAKHKKLLAQHTELSAGMSAYLATPLPLAQTPISQVSLLSVDFETTGLNSQHDYILSIGFAHANCRQVSLRNRYHQIIDCPSSLDKENVAIHQITDQDKRTGITTAQALDDLLHALAGKIMLAHHAKIECEFLTNACQEIYGFSPLFPAIDTLLVEKRQLERLNKSYDPQDLRLINLRKKYRLPAHYQHNALTDAIATAELFLAQSAHYPIKDRPLLSDWLK